MIKGLLKTDSGHQNVKRDSQLRANCGHRAAGILRGVNHTAITGNRSRLAFLNLCATGVYRDTRMVVPVARTAAKKVIAIWRNVDIEEGSDVS